MRKTRHRRRFHTDRIVANRRRRYRREAPSWASAENNPRRFGYGALSDRDPWDCGGRCFLCHYEKLSEPRRAREKRTWREDWDL